MRRKTNPHASDADAPNESPTAPAPVNHGTAPDDVEMPLATRPRTQDSDGAEASAQDPEERHPTSNETDDDEVRKRRRIERFTPPTPSEIALSTAAATAARMMAGSAIDWSAQQPLGGDDATTTCVPRGRRNGPRRSRVEPARDWTAPSGVVTYVVHHDDSDARDATRATYPEGARAPPPARKRKAAAQLLASFGGADRASPTVAAAGGAFAAETSTESTTDAVPPESLARPNGPAPTVATERSRLASRDAAPPASLARPPGATPTVASELSHLASRDAASPVSLARPNGPVPTVTTAWSRLASRDAAPPESLASPPGATPTVTPERSHLASRDAAPHEP